jgi:hypothetical protein
MSQIKADYLVIGAGFYGVCIALHLREKFPSADICIIERESKIMSRASYSNQARVHNGYHYPRSFVTAYRSRINFPHFCKDFPFAIKKDFIKLYGVAKQNSKINALQFHRFCKNIGAKIYPAQKKYRNLFNMNLIEDLFETEEYAFDSKKISEWANVKLDEANIHVVLNSQVNYMDDLKAKKIFNTCYSGLNFFSQTSTTLKHEITEMALIELPLEFQNIAITVMDGPFFSIMPFPALGLNTLSHVRYTPHMNWIDSNQINPYDVLDNYAKVSRYDRMLRDVKRYLPLIEKATYQKSLFEIKTVLSSNEKNDGRPILFETYSNAPNMYAILGGKIDNIYDILERIDSIL